jgi:hypothetical protein
MTSFAINPGIDHRNTIGKVAPGIFAQEGRCWRFVYENVAGHAGHCPEPVEWVGRWKFLKGWTMVWSCERHTTRSSLAMQEAYALAEAVGLGDVVHLWAAL